MRRKKTLFFLLLFSVLALLSNACQSSPKEVEVTAITLDKSSLILTEGETVTLIATVKPDDATNKTVAWSTSDASVATVSDGKVSAVKEGKATITAKAGGKTATCTVTVNKKQVAVSAITLDKTALTLTEGESETLTAMVFPDNATDKSVTWSSSNNAVATVNGGKVSAVQEGKATITAKAGDKTATCEVTVAKQTIAVTSISLDKTTLSLTEGQSEILTATVKPDDASDKTVTWITSNSSVATVNGGNVTAIKEGTATITAQAGDKTATCEVTVKKKIISISSITLDRSSLTLAEGESETLIATVYPENASDKTVTWITSNSAVATVNGGIVTAIKEGTATITAQAGDKTATCEVTVTKKVIPVTSITLNRSSITLLEGENETLAATVYPEAATDKTIKWTTTNSEIASVDQNGTVTAVKEGSANIIATAGNQSATCTVTVNKKMIPVTDVSLNKTTLLLKEGESEILIATVLPENATEKTLTWTSSNSTIASVDQDGKVTAVKEGIAVICVQAGAVSATCDVTVSQNVIPVSSVLLSRSSLTLTEGETETLSATVLPETATDKTVTWTSSSNDIVTVDQSGEVTAIKEGEAVIAAQAGAKTATCKVTVNKRIIDVISITLNKDVLLLKEGESETLIATVKPDDATDKTVLWTTANSAVASVDQNGRVIAIKEGTTVITAKAGDKSATCEVTVNKSIISVSSITLSETSLSLTEGESETLIATVKPDDATDRTVTWSSSNSAIASVDQNGKVIAVREGTSTITARAGDKIATCEITVNKRIVEVTSIVLDHATLNLLEGESGTLVATVNPDDATDKTVTWISSNVEIAIVDQNGKVTAIKEGSATITAMAGNQEAHCTVIVNKKTIPVSYITLNKYSVTLKVGETTKLVVTVKPDDASDKTVTWSSLNLEVATVTQDGTVMAIAEGTAVIMASAGDKTVTCEVTVKPAGSPNSGQNENYEFENWN